MRAGVVVLCVTGSPEVEAVVRGPDGLAKGLTPGSVIIGTTSEQAYDPSPELYDYAQTKAATMNYVKSLAKQLGPKGIRVNAVCPGWVKTRAALRSLTKVSDAAGIDEDTMLGQILGAQALPGLMEPDDVASLYLFLASDHAKNITGQAVNVDRGDTMV